MDVTETYAELARLVVELTWRIDHGQASRVHELFVDDGVLALGGRQEGREAIRGWGVQREASPRQSRHVCTDMRFTVASPTEADGTTTVTVYLREGDGPASTVPTVIGEYQDTFTRAPDGGWAFRTRSMTAFSRAG